MSFAAVLPSVTATKMITDQVKTAIIVGLIEKGSVEGLTDRDLWKSLGFRKGDCSVSVFRAALTELINGCEVRQTMRGRKVVLAIF